MTTATRRRANRVVAVACTAAAVVVASSSVHGIGSARAASTPPTVLAPSAALPVPALPVPVQPVAAPPAVSPTALSGADAVIAARLAARIGSPALGRDLSVRVQSPAHGLVFARQSRERQLPASNMKLVTAFTSLTALGPDHRMPTSVAATPSGRRLVLVGGGDPLLTATSLRKLAARSAMALEGLPGESARVRVRVDDSLFPRPSRAVGWRSSYGLGEISPVRALGRRGVRSKDTALEAGAVFVRALRGRGIDARLIGRGSADGLDEVARVAGHRLDSAVGRMLLDSDNQVAEVLFRQVAVGARVAPTWSGAAAAGRSVLRSAGLPVTGVRLADGSGLSRANRLTAVLLERLARRVTFSPSPQLSAIVPALPVSGVSGTLRNRYGVGPQRCARGRVQAKTGFVDGVVALSGVARGVDGRDRTFSIVANHIPSRRYSVTRTQQAVDRLAATITGCY